jgi:hypothetical protein
MLFLDEPQRITISGDSNNSILSAVDTISVIKNTGTTMHRNSDKINKKTPFRH